MKRIVLLVSLIIIYSQQVFSQELLTVDEAVALALDNNYSIKLSKNDLLVAKENVTYGNAGILPTVTANLNQNNNIQNSTQKQATGETRSLDNARNNSLTYGVNVGWTIFDGLGMFARYETLKELEKQGDILLKKTIVARVSEVISTYYTIVEQQNLLNALDSSILISKERLRTAENRFTIGKASRLEVLNVQVNLNEDESNRLRQSQTVKNLKIALNSLLARPLITDFLVVETVEINEQLKLADLLEQASQHNPDLLAASIARRLAELQEKTVKANRYPTVRVNGGYNFSRTESSLGFVASSNSKGLNYGITASVNIFDGLNQRRNERVAKLNVDQVDLQIAQQKLTVETALTQAYQSYITNLELTGWEAKNERIAKQNLSITLEKYRIGTISAVEFRDAQQNFIQAVSRYNAALLEAKLSEANLLELVGKLNITQ
ncbi:TolC family protein [Sphingobacterium sp. Mn56C]|uniref:TolC family protein n=1 Tax=Sphingobacterium sp. Mn56C TaxID=3395261 RepID=UPI003BDE3D2D